MFSESSSSIARDSSFSYRGCDSSSKVASPIEVKGLCMKGDLCNYMHQMDPDRMPECEAFNATGRCYDPDCMFRHVEQQDRQVCRKETNGYYEFGAVQKLDARSKNRLEVPTL